MDEFLKILRILAEIEAEEIINDPFVVLYTDDWVVEICLN
jgi:hypothetical protein